MGVPRLFPWITRLFKGQVKHFCKEGIPNLEQIDYLYLDSNGLLHNAAQVVFNYGAGKCFLNSYQNLTREEALVTVYTIYYDLVKEIYQIIKPTTLLYLAIDGPAPLAKQAQQRERRFVAAKERLTEEDSFDSNCISPGTRFMSELDKYMRYRLRVEMNNDPILQRLKILYSPPSVPGEGEHKIMDFIRTLSVEERGKRHCMFGPDGDLIMLTLAMHIPNIYLFRHDLYSKGFFHLLNMGAIQRLLPKSIQSRPCYDTSNDFIVMGLFVGNDFLPKIQMFHLLEHGLDVMIRISKKTGYLTQSNHISFKGLRMFINELVKYENDWLVDQIETKDTRRQPPKAEFINQTLSQCVKNGKINKALYKRLYYQKAGEPDIKTLCHDYLKTLIWVFEYYVNGLAAWRWAYRHHYAPLMEDFAEYISNLSEKEYRSIERFDLNSASLPFEQLMSILPPKSALKLLPKPVSKKMTEPGPLVELGYFPDTFKIDYEGKLQEYQGVALLPFVEYDNIHKEADGFKHYRNVVGSIYEFSYDPSCTLRYTCTFGTIKKHSVRVV